jgi:hypothetical protein
MCSSSKESNRYLSTVCKLIEVYGGNHGTIIDGLLSLPTMIGTKGEATMLQSPLFRPAILADRCCVFSVGEGENSTKLSAPALCWNARINHRRANASTRRRHIGQTAILSPFANQLRPLKRRTRCNGSVIFPLATLPNHALLLADEAETTIWRGNAFVKISWQTSWSNFPKFRAVQCFVTQW